MTRERLLDVVVFCLTLLSAISQAHTSHGSPAGVDRSQFPVSDWPRYYYVECSPGDAGRYQAVALQLVVPSMSRTPVLEQCLPAEVSPGLYRLDLAGLGWDLAAWQKVIAGYPYQPGNALVLRADWLLATLTDQHESAAYYPLVFGKTPKTRDEALAILGVDAAPQLRYGMIEGQSGVSKQGVRWIENRPASRGYCWGTKDVLRLSVERDMLEQPEGDFVHDGEEWIVGVRKFSLATGRQGALQVYFLANGAGKIVDRAPVDLVEDHTEFRTFREIRVAGSCIQCHAGGLNRLKRNELRELVKAGVEPYADYANQQAVEAFHFADLVRDVDRDVEDFSAIVREACRCEPEEAALAYQSAIYLYDKPLTLAGAAAEVGLAPEDLRDALAYANDRGVKLSARLAGLAHGLTIPRRAWEQEYPGAETLARTWSSR